MDSPVHNSTSIFNTIRNSSTESIVKTKEDTASSSSSHHCFVLNLSALTTQQQQQLDSIFLKIQIFFYHLKEKLTKSVNTLHPSISNEDQQQTDAATVLKVLKSHVDSITRFTDKSLESIGRKASEILTEVTQRVQALEKDLEEGKVSARFYNAIFSAVVMLVAALLAPISALAVAPFLQRFDLVWDDVMEKRILGKLKVFRTILSRIHFEISMAGKIQDTIHALSDMMTDLVYARSSSLVGNDGSAFNDSKMKPFGGNTDVIRPSLIANGLNDLKTNSLEGKGKAVMGLSSTSSYSPVVINDSNDFSEMRDVKLEGKVVVVGKGKAVMGLLSSSSLPVLVNDSNDFSEMRDAKLEGKVVVVGKGKAVMGLPSSSSLPVLVNDSNDFSEMRDAKLEGKVVVVDDSGALQEEGQLQEARFNGLPSFLEIGDATKRLLEVEKAMAAAMVRVEMAEHMSFTSSFSHWH